MIYIYGLSCPISGEIRYIGKSLYPKKRLRAHICGASLRAYDHHTARWIRKLLSDGKEPQLVILDSVPNGSNWQDREREWISAADHMRWPLTNSTAGGEGLDYRQSDDEARYRKNLSAAMKKKWSDPEFKAASLKKLQEGAADPDVKRSRVKAVSDAYKNPDLQARQAEITRESWKDPAVKAARAAGNSASWAKDRERRIAALNDPEVKARHKAARKASWADPVMGARLRAIASSPERRAQLSASAKLREARKREAREQNK